MFIHILHHTFQSMLTGWCQSSFSTMPKRNKRANKRQQNQNHKPPKRQCGSESPNTLNELTNITDVNDDCLARVFMELSLSDLINIAETSKLLINAARLAFKSKYGKHEVRLYGSNSNRKIRYIHYSSLGGYSIKIRDFPTCLKVIRCFGSLIPKLFALSLGVSEHKRDEIKHYLNEYCGDSVVTLNYEECRLDNTLKPYQKEIVKFSHCHFKCEPVDINRCFPNVRDLSLPPRAPVECIIGHIPNLNQLDVFIDRKKHDEFARFLRLNPQLRTLRIFVALSNIKLLRILSECPQLENLKMHGVRATCFPGGKTSKPVSIHFKTVKTFETYGYHLLRIDEGNVSVQFDQLVELTILGEMIDDSVIRFMSKHPSISKLNTYLWYEVMNEAKTLQLAKALPSVTEVRCRSYYFSADLVLNFLNECRLLKFFQFRLAKNSTFYELRGVLGAEWRSSRHENGFVTLER